MKTIYVKAVARPAEQLEIQDDCSVKDLRKQAAGLTGLRAEQAKLVCNGKALTDDSLDCSDIKEGDTVVVFVRAAAPMQPRASEGRDEPADLLDDDAATTAALNALLTQCRFQWQRDLAKVLRTRCSWPDQAVLVLYKVPPRAYAAFLLWCIASRTAATMGLGPLFFITSGFAMIFLNLGKREEGESSAYSVFNEGFRELPGTMNAGMVDQQLRHQDER